MSRTFDPVLIEVVKNELAAIAEETAIAIARTGRSSQVKVGDFAAALSDSGGRIIGVGHAAPFQLAAFMSMMSYFLDKWSRQLGEGDIFLANDPYAGMGHMPDVALITPVFRGGELAAFVLAYSHHTDIGGRFPGGFSSQCTESFEEGIRLPIVRLCERGKLNQALLDTILANVRTQEDWLGDLDAKIAGCRRGVEEFHSLLDKHGLETFKSTCDYLNDYSESQARAAIQSIPNGRYIHEDVFDDDGFGNKVDSKLRVELNVQGDLLKADFTGTAKQAKGAVNVPFSATKSMVLAALKAIVSPDVLLNHGFVQPISVVAPLGTLLNPRFPAAVGGRSPLFHRTYELVFGALAKALPDKVPAAGRAGDLLHFHGQAADGKPFAMVDILFGGWGARPAKDGIDGVTPVYFGTYGAAPTELLERSYPIVVEGFGFLADSGGPGKYRGSVSVYKQWRVLSPGRALLRTIRPYSPSGGLAGGEPGAIAENILRRQGITEMMPRQTHQHIFLEDGDRIYHSVGGCGGHGNPFERDPEKVLADVRDEKLTVSGAYNQYGVAIDPITLRVDNTETAALRQHRLGQQSKGVQ